jgi:hypothetical protein
MMMVAVMMMMMLFPWWIKGASLSIVSFVLDLTVAGERTVEAVVATASHDSKRVTILISTTRCQVVRFFEPFFEVIIVLQTSTAPERLAGGRTNDAYVTHINAASSPRTPNRNKPSLVKVMVS